MKAPVWRWQWYSTMGSLESVLYYILYLGLALLISTWTGCGSYWMAFMVLVLGSNVQITVTVCLINWAQAAIDKVVLQIDSHCDWVETKCHVILTKIVDHDQFILSRNSRYTTG